MMTLRLFSPSWSLALSLSAATLATAVAKPPTNHGSAQATYAEVNGEPEMVATQGSRKISGVYPHLTTYSQSRKDGKFFKAGHEECGIGGSDSMGRQTVDGDLCPRICPKALITSSTRSTRT